MEVGEPIETFADVVGLALNLERVWGRASFAHAKAIEAQGWTSLPESWFDASSTFQAEADSRYLDDAQSRALAVVMRERT